MAENLRDMSFLDGVRFKVKQSTPEDYQAEVEMPKGTYLYPLAIGAKINVQITNARNLELSCTILKLREEGGRQYALIQLPLPSERLPSQTMVAENVSRETIALAFGQEL